MAKYEGLFLVEPSLEGEELDKVLADINSSITNNGGEVVDSQMMGKRRLAYQIIKRDEGICYRLLFRIGSEQVHLIREANKMKETILRSMIIREKE